MSVSLEVYLNPEILPEETRSDLHFLHVWEEHDWTNSIRIKYWSYVSCHKYSRCKFYPDKTQHCKYHTTERYFLCSLLFFHASCQSLTGSWTVHLTVSCLKASKIIYDVYIQTFLLIHSSVYVLALHIFRKTHTSSGTYYIRFLHWCNSYFPFLARILKCLFLISLVSAKAVSKN